MLTAAHCFLNETDGTEASQTPTYEKSGYAFFNPGKVLTYFTVDSASALKKINQMVQVESIMLHPDFDNTNKANDYAIVTLKGPVNASISTPAKLAGEQCSQSFNSVTAFGIGMNENGQFAFQYPPQQVRKVDMGQRRSCPEIDNITLASNIICFDVIEGRDTGAGDSGGRRAPLVPSCVDSTL